VLQQHNLTIIQEFKGLVLIPLGLTNYKFISSDTDTKGSYMGFAVKYAKHSYIV